MKKSLLILLLFTIMGSCALMAQTVDELKSTISEKKAQAASLQGEADALQAKIDAMPGWKKGAFGTIGANLSGFNNWFSKETVNSTAVSIGFTGNAFANLMEEKFFWRNSGNINIGWLKFDDTDKEPGVNGVADDEGDFKQTSDVFNISSLYGRKLNDKWAISTLGEYRTTLLNNFNDPGYLDIGVGATWTPIPAMVVVFHPLNYNYVFSKGDSDFNSSLGCKVVADYTKSLPKGISWKSNLSGFLSYEDAANFSNWTWVNNISLSLFKGLGVGFEFGLRSNKQEAYSGALAANAKQIPSLQLPLSDFSLDGTDNKIQNYWLLGFSYSL